ncbi:armadillo-type protein [Mycena epipterygia]|nr:armadillo-type protein [Mycena epipterygia]
MSHRRNHPSKSADRVPRKVTSLLNQLAVSNFDSISGQIVAIADQAEGEGDARTLVSLTRVLYDTAISQPMRAELYARLCRHLMKQISHKVQDDDAKDAEGKPITGGLLFLRYLLGRLETGLEKGFPTEDLPDEPETETPRRLGLVRFMGEVFKLQMSTERMMHECIKKLLRIKKSLGQADPPLGAILEALYVLLHSVGALLDTQKAAPHMAVYFSRIRELSSHSEIPLRLRFMLVDLIDLRARNWTSAPRTGSDDPIPVGIFRCRRYTHRILIDFI